MEISIAAEKVFEVGGITVTNSMLASVAVLLILTFIAFFSTRRMSLVPKGLQNAVEMGIESLAKLMDGIFQNKTLTYKVLPLIATFFIFILFNNWFGLIPGVGTIGVNEIKEGKEVLVPLFRAGTADLNTTIMLGGIAVIAAQILGMGALGMRGHWSKFFNFSSPIMFFVGILELLGEFTRVISFSFRLFGNIFAGEVLLVVISSLTPYLIPIPFYAMEIFVGFIQALVFSMLAIVFIKMSTISHASHES